MCFGCSKEPPHWDGAVEYTQHIIWLKKNQIHTLIIELFAYCKGDTS